MYICRAGRYVGTTTTIIIIIIQTGKRTAAKPILRPRRKSRCHCPRGLAGVTHHRPHGSGRWCPLGPARSCPIQPHPPPHPPPIHPSCSRQQGGAAARCECGSAVGAGLVEARQPGWLPHSTSSPPAVSLKTPCRPLLPVLLPSDSSPRALHPPRPLGHSGPTTIANFDT